jgi:hypothetical protein
MRYLQKCVADLQAHRDTTSIPLPPKAQPSSIDEDDSDEEDEEKDDLNAEADEDMADAVSEEPPHTAAYPFASSSSAMFVPNISPDIAPSNARRYSVSTSPAQQPSDLQR